MNKEILDKIEEKYPVHIIPLTDKDAHDNMIAEHERQAAISGFHLRDEEVEEIRNAAITQSNIATDRLIERDKEIERLKGLLKIQFSIGLLKSEVEPAWKKYVSENNL